MEENAQGFSTNSKKSNVFIVFGIILLITIVAVYFYIRHTKYYISTDDAYVTGRIHSIAPKVAGTIKDVYVDDNQLVKKGTLLLDIDSKDYDVKSRDARATVDSEQLKLSELSVRVDVAQKQLVEIQSRIDATRATLALQEANLKQANQDLSRARRLYDKGIVAEVSLEKATTAFDVSKAQVDAAREQVKQALASLETQKLVIQQSKTAYLSQGYILEQKRQMLISATMTQGYTKLYAPSDGYITKKNVEVGNQVQVGQPLMALVPLNDLWIVANYKETQLTEVKPGQKVQINIDMYPGRTFSGTVDSIMAGTGSVFSLFPPENATGNYVKVVQRIPVKIILEKDTDPDHILRVGMSVQPTIAVKMQ